MKRKFHEKEKEIWSVFCMNHPDLKQAHDCLINVPLNVSIRNKSSPDLVDRLHVEVTDHGKLRPKWGVVFPWFADTDGVTCSVCKQGVESVKHFVLECRGFEENFDSLWEKLKTKVTELNPADGDHNVNFVTNLDQHHKVLLQ